MRTVQESGLRCRNPQRRPVGPVGPGRAGQELPARLPCWMSASAASSPVPTLVYSSLGCFLL